MSDSEPEDRVLHQTHQLGSGAYADVYAATDDASGSVVAYKKARTSARVRRPLLQHEARVLQLLQGHRAVPALIGYERAPHFEHIAMEMLGDHLGQLVEDGQAVSPITVLRVGEQMISALQHIHARNIIHRDVKPSNILVALDDPSRVCLIDYGLARRLSAEEMTSPPTKRYDPLESDKCIIGSVDWCSLNAHEGIDLRPRDDIESLAYTLFFLVLGRLPWRIDYRREPTAEQYPRVQSAKKAFTAALPLPDIPAPLTDLLRAAHASKGDGDMAASLQSVCERFRSDIEQYSQQNNPALDWTPVPIPASAPPLMPSERKDRPDRPVRARKRERGSDEYSDSYKGRWYLEMVPLPGRAHSLTFPEDEAAMLDALISDELYVSD